MANRTRARRRAVVDHLPVADINTTPLIDVMLVLLVMIIITIPVQLHAVNLHLPVGDPPRAARKPEVVQIDIAPGGALGWKRPAVVRREVSLACPGCPSVLASVLEEAIDRVGIAGTVRTRLTVRGGQVTDVALLSWPDEVQVPLDVNFTR